MRVFVAEDWLGLHKIIEFVSLTLVLAMSMRRECECALRRGGNAGIGERRIGFVLESKLVARSVR